MYVCGGGTGEIEAGDREIEQGRAGSTEPLSAGRIAAMRTARNVMCMLLRVRLQYRILPVMAVALPSAARTVLSFYLAPPYSVLPSQ